MTSSRTGAHRIRPRNAHTMLRVPALPRPGEPRHAARPDLIADLVHLTLPLRVVPTWVRR